MTWLDYVVLAVYFLCMAGIGFWSMRRIKGQEDYFLGGRSFGKILQAFAAFGAGTGSADPVNTARTTFTSGFSGMWSVMYWLFVTPFYWITGVWYRRMRHLTLGDWFSERYESKSLAGAYTVFGLIFYMVYTSMLFTAVGKVAAPLVGADQVGGVGIEYILVPLIAAFVVIYGVLGGLKAAYWTDLIQGIFIILLSVLLIPVGLKGLVARFGDPATEGALSGFRIMHEQIPADFLKIVGTGRGSEFPLYRIVAVVIINLVGIVVQPHFIATGGGSAKSETDARVGLVAGNFFKRFCTVGWAITALIVLALFADSPELIGDPDRVWGVASRELLAPGLLGLMLACLLAALMSSADCYMIVCSGLVVRNIYVPFIRRDASETQCLRVGRWTGLIVIAGAVVISLQMMDVFRQLELSWIVPMVFAAPFWLGMYWRKATRAGAWATLAYGVIAFGIIPLLVPRLTSLQTHPDFIVTNDIVITETHREAAPSDVAQRTAAIRLWEQDAARGDTPCPQAIRVGADITVTTTTGGKPIYWTGTIVSADAATPLATETVSTETTDSGSVTVKRYTGPRQATGNFRLDFLFYRACGLDLASKSNAALDSLSLLPKIILPFLVMMLVSLCTKRTTPAVLDRYYAKMRTPVDPDPGRDRQRLVAAYASPADTQRVKLFPNSSWEFQRPTRTDVIGFIVCFGICFLIIGFAAWIATIGG